MYIPMIMPILTGSPNKGVPEDMYPLNVNVNRAQTPTMTKSAISTIQRGAGVDCIALTTGERDRSVRILFFISCFLLCTFIAGNTQN